MARGAVPYAAAAVAAAFVIYSRVKIFQLIIIGGGRKGEKWKR